MIYEQPSKADLQDVRYLSQAEHLVVFGFRAVTLGYGDSPTVNRTFRGLLGLEGDGALSNLFVFARMVGSMAQRPLRLHAPGCCQLGEDERLVIAAVASAQAMLRGADASGLTVVLERLMDASPCETVMVAAQNFAAALTLGGAELTLRTACGRNTSTVH